MFRQTLLLIAMWLSGCSVLHYTAGESFTWPFFTVKLSSVGCTLTNTTNTIPFLVVDEVAADSMNISFGFAAAGTSAWVASTVASFRPLRVDSGRNLRFTLSTAVATANDSRSTVSVKYRRTAANGNTTNFTGSIVYQCTGTRCAGTATNTAVIGGVAFEAISTAQLPFILRYAQPATSIWTADITNISLWHLSRGLLQPNDEIVDVSMSHQLWGVGSLSFQSVVVTPDRWDYYYNATVHLNGMSLVHSAVPWVLYTLDYSNTTMPAGGTNAPSDITYDFRLLNNSNNQSLKVPKHTI